MLMDMGIDLERLYANLYLSEYEELKYHSFVLNKMRLTKNGVAHFYISLDAQKKFGLTAEQACEAVSYLGGLKGSIIWLAFIENADGTVRVRLRSRFVTVNKLAEKYGGGGHAWRKRGHAEKPLRHKEGACRCGRTDCRIQGEQHGLDVTKNGKICQTLSV